MKIWDDLYDDQALKDAYAPRYVMPKFVMYKGAFCATVGPAEKLGRWKVIDHLGKIIEVEASECSDAMGNGEKLRDNNELNLPYGDNPFLALIEKKELAGHEWKIPIVKAKKK